MKKQKRIASQVERKKRVLSQDEINLDKPISQADFGRLVGIAQQNVSQLCQYNVLSPDGTGTDWSREYIRFQMGIIYGRGGWAALARSLGD
jgi:hypothetical protein